MRIAITGSHGVGKTTLTRGLFKYIKEDEMKIGITGSHGTGKTTLAKKVAGKKCYHLLPDVVVEAFQAGFIINEETSLESELWIFAKQAEHENRWGDNWVADKCFIDLLAYAKYLFPKNNSLLDVLNEVAVNAMKKYDKVIYLPSGEFPIEDDGLRSTDIVFQKSIDDLIAEIMFSNNIHCKKIIGNREYRFNETVKYIFE